MQIPSELAALLATCQRVLVVSHVSPDGDTIGSALGLAWALRARGVEVRLACADAVPPELRFIPGSDEFSARQPSDEQAILCIDLSDTARMGFVYQAELFSTRPVVNIDHHITNTGFGNINLVAPTASTAEIIYALIRALGWPLDARIATCLLAGLVADTLGFRTSNTGVAALRAASELMEAGAPLYDIAQAVFNHRSLATMRLWGAVLTQARLEGELLWAEIPHSLLAAHHSDAQATKGLINYLSSCGEARVTALFREADEGQVEVGFRSKPGYDVSAVALALGGGGHPQAAGCLVRGELADVRERVLAALRPLMGAPQVMAAAN